MTGISTILNNVFNFFSVDLFGSTVIFSILLLILLIVLLFQMGATRFVVMAFVVPLLAVLTFGSGWITQTWIGFLGLILIAIFGLMFILRRLFIE